MRQLLPNKNFRYLWMHNSSLLLNLRFREIVIPLIVLALTTSPVMTSLVAMSQRLATVLFAIPFGTWVETKNKIRISATSHILYAACIFLLAYLISSNQVTLASLILLLFMMGALEVVSTTVVQVVVPRVVGRTNLLQANTALEAGDALVTLVGPALGGFILAQYGHSVTLYVCGILSLLSMLLISFVKYQKFEQTEVIQETKNKTQDFIIRSIAGIKYLTANMQQKISIIFACSLGFTTVYITLVILYHARISLGFSEEYIGIILASAGIGNILGILIIPYLRRSNWIFLLCTLSLCSAAGILLMMSDQFIIICIGMIVFDGALSMGFIVQLSAQQGITEDHFLSRIRSATYVLGGIVAIVATFLSGALTEWISSYFALSFGALVIAIPGVLLLFYCKHGTPMNKVNPITLEHRSSTTST
ncbi:MFS transporter [Geomicrobium sp. JSM 1781026]|uniref:MFS transporter n=1 Tax=Geomicrobium sp. JSM 1781026 TaxID=3344580 RepID=UPI0035BF468E